MKKLSPAMCQLVVKAFAPQDQAEAAQVLANDLADDLPFLENQDEYGLEPVRFAVVKLSRGNTAELRWWVNLARVDWQDVLEAAGFGSATAYREWASASYGITWTKPSVT